MACVADGRLAIGVPGILTLDGEPQWQVTVDEVTLDATDEILAFDESNVSPRPQFDDALATVTLTYLGDESTGRPGGLVARVDGVNYVYNLMEINSSPNELPPPSLAEADDMNPGDTITGHLSFAVPRDTDAAAAADLRLMLSIEGGEEACSVPLG